MVLVTVIFRDFVRESRRLVQWSVVMKHSRSVLSYLWVERGRRCLRDDVSF